MVFGLAVVNTNLKVLILSYEHSIGSLLINGGSMAVYLITVLIISAGFKSSYIYYSFIPLLKLPLLHIGNILVIGCTSFIDYFLEIWDSNSITINFLGLFEAHS